MTQAKKAGLAAAAVLAVLGGLLVALLSPAERAQAAPATLTVSPAAAASINVATNSVYNWSAGSTGIGVIRYQDHISANGKYDAVLGVPNGTAQTLGWLTTSGFYVGPGYCVDAYRHDNGLSGSFPFQGTFGAGRHFIGAHTSYILEAYRC